MFEKVFKLSKNGTNAKTEIMAGITTFMTMAYILAVNPSILADAGMDSTAVLLATAISSFIATCCMAFMANLPFALSAGMGLNAFLAYTVVLGYGYSWQVALLAVFVEGIVFIVLSLTNIREAIFNAIPLNLKRGVSVGIGLFIAFIGLQNAGLSVDASTLVTITSFTDNFNTSGICALLALVGLFITAVLYIKNVKGAILIGIIATWVIGMLCQVAGVYVPDNVSYFSLFPTMGLTDFSKLGETVGQCFNVDFSNVHKFSHGDIMSIRNAGDAFPTSVIMTTEKDCQRVRDSKAVPESLKQRMFYAPIKTEFLRPEDQEKFKHILKELLK